ncbi:NAD(P)-binding protein [Lophiostoma macrostomum CBS 122681]|uniref:NAD(P)-binding protein n=1 Tax=Lophiostoma macrostomum CBS 122681 TaxID=1314788 RepID=A0A6A6TKU2_9PLEO|nr:NAD(P)-binding protein [Lophiostoma macrostomum CBS 122681]
MAPIRVGIIGLSANSGIGPSWAKIAHLPYLAASPHYSITGILNTSLESSQKAIQTFNLSKTAKPFSDLNHLTSDPNIDLIVVAVEVKKHAALVKAAIEHGKNVYCEWPLDVNHVEAEKLAALAKEKGVKTYVGLENRRSPPWTALRDIISSGKIGDVLSTSVTATLGPIPQVWTERAAFYLDVYSGQSPLHTRVAHFLDGFCFALGEFDKYEALLETHQKEIKVCDVPVTELADAAKNPDTKFKVLNRTAPDEMALQGRLDSGAVASVHFRSGPTDADGNILRWIIVGSQGLIEVTQKSGQFMRGTSVAIKVVKDGDVTDVKVDWDLEGEFKMYGEAVGLTTPARNYKAFAEEDHYAITDFQHAVKRHKMLDQIIKRGMAGR